LAGQLLMVLQKTETWPVWIVVNTVGAVLYFSQGLYFTSLFYAVLILMAVAGWRAWSSRSPATTVASPAPAGAGPFRRPDRRRRRGINREVFVGGGTGDAAAGDCRARVSADLG